MTKILGWVFWSLLLLVCHFVAVVHQVLGHVVRALSAPVYLAIDAFHGIIGLLKALLHLTVAVLHLFS